MGTVSYTHLDVYKRQMRERAADRYPAFDRWLAPKPHTAHDADPYATPFYQRYRKLLDACLRHRWLVIGITILAFVLSIALFRFVPQQFFPDSVRPEPVSYTHLDVYKRQDLGCGFVAAGGFGWADHDPILD